MKWKCYNGIDREIVLADPHSPNILAQFRKFGKINSWQLKLVDGGGKRAHLTMK